MCCIYMLITAGTLVAIIFSNYKQTLTDTVSSTNKMSFQGTITTIGTISRQII